MVEQFTAVEALPGPTRVCAIAPVTQVAARHAATSAPPHVFVKYPNPSTPAGAIKCPHSTIPSDATQRGIRRTRYAIGMITGPTGCAKRIGI